MQIQTKIKITEIQTTTATDTTTIKITDITIVAINKTIDITTVAIHQISNKTETTQTRNPADIVTEQIINRGIVKPVLIAEDWDTCLASVEHHDKIRTMGNKIQMLTITREITNKTATPIPLSTKTL